MAKVIAYARLKNGPNVDRLKKRFQPKKTLILKKGDA
jgi:hypothetical protein